MNSLPPNPTLGTYADRGQLDHDTATLLEALIAEMAGRGVERSAALASLRRATRGA